MPSHPSLTHRLVASLRRIAAALLLVFAFGLAYLLAITSMPGTSHRGAQPPLSAEEQALANRLRAHVTQLASAERNVAHPAQLEAAALYLERELATLGYDVQRQTFQTSGATVRNLQVTIPSASSHGQRVLVVGAHYDSAQGTPGANDNATGAAAIVELARRLKDVGTAGSADLVLVLYTNEEPPYFRTPLMGSSVHAKTLKARNANVVGMLSLETMGYFSDQPGSQNYPWPLDMFYPRQGDFIAFVASSVDWRFVRTVAGAFRNTTAFPAEGIAAPRFLPGIDFSDHAAYIDEGYPALMVTDSAPYRYPHYHSPRDTPDKVDFDKLARVVLGVEQVIQHLARAQ
jgi:Peptidase family M28